MKNKKIIITTAIIVILLFIATIVGIQIRDTQKTKLIQLSDNTSRQMMGYVLKTNKGKIIVIDGGTTGDTDNLVRILKQNGGKVDMWFLTHAHDDHAGAFTQIANNDEIKIEKVCASLNDKEWYEENEPARAEFSKNLIDTVNSEKFKNKVITPSLNDKLEIDNINIEILGIRNPEITENPGNEQSMVIKFDTGKTTLLILGDTGEKSSAKLLQNQKEKLKSDIVQMSHHGQAGATEELYKAVSPTICLWPTPDWLWDNDNGGGKNSGPWKTLETRSWMENMGVKKNYVEKDGDIEIKID